MLAGVGKQTFRVRTLTTPEAEERISVTVQDLVGRIRKEGSIYLTNVTPRVSLYLSTPLGGIDPRAAVTATQRIKRGSADLQAEPFFFATPSRNKLSYAWSVANIQPKGGAQNPSLMTVETSDNSLGYIPVTITVSNDDPFTTPITATANLVIQ